jgi:hypothetical protein
MAKGSSSKGGSSKVRLIVFEAEMSDGDLSQVTQAIQNALQPRPAPIRMIQAAPQASIADGSSAFDENELLDKTDELASEPARPRSQRPAKPRVAKTPTVLDDIDVSSAPSLKDFVAEYELSSTVDKYLVVALWFRDARSTSNITVDHVYTCFKLLGWSTSANDFSKPLRNLRDEQSMKGGSREGFALTLPGAGKIEAKRRAQ